VLASSDWGHISKQGKFLVALLVGGSSPKQRRAIILTGDVGNMHLAMRRHKSIAKVAMGPQGWRVSVVLDCGGMAVSIRGR